MEIHRDDQAVLGHKAMDEAAVSGKAVTCLRCSLMCVFQHTFGITKAGRSLQWTTM